MGENEQNTGGLPRREAGFTLVEVLAVVVVLGILVAYGVPTFLRARGGPSDAAARSRARQALITQKTFYTDRGLWGAAAEIQPLEPSVEFVDLGSEGPQVMGKVYVKVNADVATLVSRSATGNCYWVRSGPTGTTFATVSCSTPPADTDFDTSW